MEKRRWEGLVAVLVTVFIWGISFINIKIAVAVVGPMTLGFLRFAMASVLLWFMKRRLAPDSTVAREDWAMMAWAGFIGVTLYFFFENNGVKLISAGSAAIIVSAIPVATLLSEAVAYRRPLTLRVMGCALLSVIGVGMVTGISPVPGENPLGYWLMGGAVISWVVYCLISKGLFERYSSLTITYYQTLVGTVLFVPFMIFETTAWEQVTPVIWMNIAILGVFASAIGFYLYLLAMDRLGVGMSSMYLNIIPIVTLLTGVLIMGETVSWGQCGGAALVIAAVMGAGKGKGKAGGELSAES